MALGRRSRRSERGKLDATPPWQEERTRDTEATTGPWDATDAPADDVERLDLGALLVPVVPGVEMRVDVAPDGSVSTATLGHGGSELQLGVFAAPRTAGIWTEVRREIRGSITSQGGTSHDDSGRFGAELVARVPVQGGFQSVRFVGVDGPRWFLRALLTGPAAVDPARAAVLEDALRGIVVVRGTDPMPVRDPLPLQLPTDVAEAVARDAAAAAALDDDPGDRPGRVTTAGNGAEPTVAGNLGSAASGSGGAADPGSGGAAASGSGGRHARPAGGSRRSSGRRRR